MIRHEHHDIIGSKPVRDETEGLGLFESARAPAVAVRGAGAEARSAARATTNTSRALRVVLAALRSAPAGLTRQQIHEATGLPVSTVNARIVDLRDKHGVVFTRGRREHTIEDGRTVNESVCHARPEVAAAWERD